jgi:hypothetical protein
MHTVSGMETNMAIYVPLDTIRKYNLSGTYDYCLLKESGGDRWKVQCWELVPEERRVTGEPEEFDFQWEVTGKVVGYVDGNPNREIREPFTEETAREEFNRWR